MIIPEFDRSRAFWDSWRAFHTNDGAWTYFDTGETVCTVLDPHPNLRGYRPKNRYSFVLTSDTRDDVGVEFLDPAGGKPMPLGWLGSQYLLLDPETMRAVRLGRTMPHAKDLWVTRKGVPVRFLDGRVCAYVPGSGRPPVGEDVTVERTVPLSPSEREHIRDVRAAAMAWMQIGEVTVEKVTGLYPAAGMWAEVSAWNQRHAALREPLDPARVLGSEFADLTPDERFRLATKGVSTRKEVTKHDYLMFQPLT